MKFLRILHKNIVGEQTTQRQLTGNNRIKVGLVMSGYPWLIILIGVLMVGGRCWFTWQQINYDYDRTMQETSLETMNLSIAFEEHVRRIIADADKELLSLKDAYEQDGISSPLVTAHIQNKAKDPARSFIAIYNEQGVIIASSSPSMLGLKRSDRDYFLVHQNNLSSDLYIGKTILGRANFEQTIPLSRRIAKPDGSFGGIVYIGLKANYFLSFYQKVNLGEQQLISLSGWDGFNRARRGGDNFEMGQDTRGNVLREENQQNISNASYLSTSLYDGITRVMSYRAMPEYPLIVAVGKSAQVALSSYEERKLGYIFGTILASFFILTCSSLLVNKAAKQQALHAKLEKLVGERTQELQSQYKILQKREEELSQLNYELAEKSGAVQQEVEEKVEKIKEIEMELTAIFESISAPFYVLDKEWRLIYINKEAEHVGIKLDKTHIGKNIWEVYPELVGSERYHKYYEACATTTPIHTIFSGLTGEELFETHLYPYANGLFVYYRDVTEQKKYEVEIARLNSLNMIGEMAASIGHEVRNPMTTVRGYLQWYTKKNAFVHYHESFTIMIEELDRANAIITDFLSLARDKAVNLILIDLNMVIRKIFPLLQADALRRGNDIELALQGVLEVHIDEKEMRQCILNLVGNGMDSMPDGGKMTIETAKIGSRVIMTVRDSGQGMPLEVKEKIGIPFFTTKENGTGLGLPVCYQIAQRHGATIEVETSPDGSAFHFIFNQKKSVR